MCTSLRARENVFSNCCWGTGREAIRETDQPERLKGVPGE